MVEKRCCVDEIALMNTVEGVMLAGESFLEEHAYFLQETSQFC